MFPNQENAIIPLLRVLAIRPPGAPPRVVYRRMKEYYPKLTREDVEEKLGPNDTRWKNMIRFAREKAVAAGWIVRDDRGNWRLTKDGKEYITYAWPEFVPVYSSKRRPGVKRRRRRKK